MPNNLREIREESNFRMWELTARCGVSASTLSAIERYDYKPSSKTREKIAIALDVPVTDIWPVEDQRALVAGA